MKSGLFISVLKRLSAKKKIYIFIYTGQTRFCVKYLNIQRSQPIHNTFQT